MKLLPLKQVISSAKTYLIPSYKEYPNSSLHNLPLIVYRPFEDDSLDPGMIEELLEKNGLIPAWRYGMFPFNHYHSNTHEVLVPYKGTAKLAFGHDSNPECIIHASSPGDVYILPAGLTHRSLEQSNDFKMVGSYPVGSHDWDNCRGNADSEDGKDKLWEKVRELGCKKENWLMMDPIYGDVEGSPFKVFWNSK